MVYATLALVSYQISGESMVSILLLATLLAHRAQRIRVHAPELVKLCVRPWQSRRASHATTRKRNNSRSIRSPYSHIKRPCHGEKTKFLLARLFYDWWQKLQHTIFYGPFLSLSPHVSDAREPESVCWCTFIVKRTEIILSEPAIAGCCTRCWWNKKRKPPTHSERAATPFYYFSFCFSVIHFLAS
jgi:hypothetical protein